MDWEITDRTDERKCQSDFNVREGSDKKIKYLRTDQTEKYNKRYRVVVSQDYAFWIYDSLKNT